MKSFKVYEPRKISDLKDMLNQTVDLFGNKTAFVIKPDLSEKKYVNISYYDFKKDIDGLGTALISLGLKDTHIALISNNRYEWGVSYLATVCGTGVIVPLDRALPDNEIVPLVQRAYVKAIIFEKKYLPVIIQMKNENNTEIQHYICMDEVEEDWILSFKDLIEKGTNLIKAGDVSFLNSTINRDILNMLLFTSGTTELSKAVMLSHKNICTNLMDTSSVTKIYPEDMFLSFLPLHHTFECSCGFLTAIYNGSSIAYCDGLKHFAANLKEYPISVLVCVPLLFENMHKKLISGIKEKGKYNKFKVAIKISKILNFFGIDIKRKLFKDVFTSLGKDLRLCVCGAAPLEKTVANTFNDIGINFIQGYGLTETSPILAGENDIIKDAGSVGFAFPSVTVELFDVNENGVGEVRAKGDSIMIGYFENEEATSAVLQDGWFYTGDLGYLNKKNHLVISGRKKTVIVLKNGKKIFPEELESLINKIPFVAECMVFGKTLSDGDSDIWAKIVYVKDKALELFGSVDTSIIHDRLQEEIKKINKNMPHYKHIRDFIFTDVELIKTTTKKIKRHEEMKTI